jgi:hypothetical protein
MREFRPIPDPAGALQPPNRRPPTAVATATPEPNRAPGAAGRPVRPKLTSVLLDSLAGFVAVPVALAGALVYPLVRIVAYIRRA